MASMQDTLTALLAPVAESFGCELWAVEYLSQGKRAILRLYIDKASGITLEDCERVSRQASSVLDVEDPIRSEYTLEVSSPGADRSLHKLAHYERFVGEIISVRLRMAFEGRRKFVGRLCAVEGDDVVVAIDNDEFLLPIDLIDKANIVPQF